jgi:hypothetical protein
MNSASLSRHCGVGQTFPLQCIGATSTLERDLAIIAHRISADDGDPLAFIRHMAELMMLYDRFLAALANMTDYDSKKNEKRMVGIISAPLADAQKIGKLLHALTGEDVLTLCRKLASNWRLDRQRS